MKLTIGHLYPDLLNLYGDRGNIQCLMKRCQWRGIEAETIPFELDDKIEFFKMLVEIGFKEIEIGFPAATPISNKKNHFIYR